MKHSSRELVLLCSEISRQVGHLPYNANGVREVSALEERNKRELDTSSRSSMVGVCEGVLIAMLDFGEPLPVPGTEKAKPRASSRLGSRLVCLFLFFLRRT